jgi:hypothetical protein
MPGIVVDTHTIVWYLAGDSRLSTTAVEVLDSMTAAAGEPIYVPAICLVELTYLIEKRRLPGAVRERLVQALNHSPESLLPGATGPRCSGRSGTRAPQRRAGPSGQDHCGDRCRVARATRQPRRSIRFSQVETIW